MLLLTSRMLKRVSVTGTEDGEPVYHEYSYIDFRPYVAPASTFQARHAKRRTSSCLVNMLVSMHDLLPLGVHAHVT